jgi:hypothetical protein
VAKAKDRVLRDEIQEEEEFNANYKELTKWAIVTRRYYHSRTVTLFSGHSKSVEAVIGYLTSESDVGELINNKEFNGKLPEEFQLLFQIKMVKDWGELYPRKPTLEESISLDSAMYAHLKSDYAS